MPRATIVLFALLLPACECFRVNPVTGKSELSLYSDSDEIALGAQAAPAMEQQSGGLYKDPALEAYVASVGARLAAASDRKGIPHHYRILNSSIINAFALPGGFIYISRGLLVKLRNEDELAGVLGHETGHVAARHGVHHLQLSMGLNVLLSVASRAAAAASPESAEAAQAGLQVADLVANLGSLKYSRDDERQADHLGLLYEERAGWDPRGMLGVMQVLKSTEQGEPGAIEAITRTHPLTSERIRNVEEELSGRAPADLDRKVKDTPEFDRQVAALREVDKAYARNDQAREKMGKQQFKEALADVDEAIHMNPRQASFFATRAAIQLQQGRNGEALTDAQRATALDPGHYEAHLMLGAAQLQSGELPQARSTLTRASGLWPGHPGAPYYLGMVAEKQGRREEAAQWYAQAAELDSSEGEGQGYGKGAAEGLARVQPSSSRREP